MQSVKASIDAVLQRCRDLSARIDAPSLSGDLVHLQGAMLALEEVRGLAARLAGEVEAREMEVGEVEVGIQVRSCLSVLNHLGGRGVGGD